MKMFKILLAATALAFSSVASAALVIDFAGLSGGTLDFADPEASGTGISISALTVEGADDPLSDGEYNVVDGELNFNTANAGFEITITGDVTGLTTGNVILFEGSFTDFSFTDTATTDIFFGEGNGNISGDLLAGIGEEGTDAFSFVGFSMETINGNVISTDFVTTQDTDKTVVPIPAAVWLFGSGLIGLVGVARRKA